MSTVDRHKNQPRLRFIGALMFTLFLAGMLMIAESVDADELQDPNEVMLLCLEKSIEAVADVPFESEEDRKDAISMLAGGCMYYQFLEQSTCHETPFAYPIEPDDSPSEFTHSF